MAAQRGLKKKIGPLPLWAWIVVLGGGVVGGLYLRSRLSGSSGAAGVGLANTTGTATPTATPAVDSGSGGAVGASQEPAPSGLDPYTENLLATETSALTSLAQTGVYAGVSAQQQSFDFASGVFGSALDFLNEHYPGSPPAVSVNIAPPATQIVYTPTPTTSGGGGAAAVSPAAGYATNTPSPLTTARQATGRGPVLQ